MSDLPETQSFSTREELGEALTQLRQQRALTVRDVAAAAGVPVATVGGYLSGRHLPPISAMDQFRKVLQTLGVPTSEHERWIEEVNRIRRIPGPRAAGSPLPYRGLAQYEPEHADIFVGREQITADLLNRVLEHPTQVVVVIGPSGSGKSSLLRAGLVAALHKRQRETLVLSASGDVSMIDQADADTVIIVDQYEEVLTDDLAAARDVAAKLTQANKRGNPIVLALRSDFFDAALGIEPVFSWLAEGPVIMPPLTVADLRRVIVEPARTVGLEVDPALVDVLVSEAAVGDDLDPGALPLISHALYVTWKAAAGRRLTLAHYREAGGLREAVARSAEKMFESLDPANQQVAHRTLLRLVHVREGAADTRRPADQREFASEESRQVIEACVAARLVTTDRGRVQLVHETLLVAWPRLRRWLDDNREQLRVRGQLTESVSHWLGTDRTPDLLYRGTALVAAQEMLAKQSSTVLTPVEQEFVDASTAAENARVAVSRRATVRLRVLAGATAVVAVVAGGLAGTGWRQSQILGQERDIAVSRQLAVTSQYLAATDPGASTQVALAASGAAETVEGRSALLTASAQTPVARVAETQALVNSLVVDPDGQWLAAATELSDIEFWSRDDDPSLLTTLKVGEAPVYSVTLAEKGQLLLAGGGDQELHVWDVADPERPEPVTVENPAVGATIYNVSTDGQGQVAAAASDGKVHLWQLTSAGLTYVGGLQVFTGTAQSVEFVGSRLFAGGSEGLLSVIELSPTPTVVATVAGADGQITDMDVSPTSPTLAVAANDYLVRIFDISDPLAPIEMLDPLSGPVSWVNGVEFSPDGTTLAAASSDKHLYTWDTQSWLPTRVLPTPGGLIAVVWEADGSQLYAGGIGKTVQTWQMPGSVLSGLGSIASQMAIADGLMIVPVRDGIRVWDVSDPRSPQYLGAGKSPDEDRLDGVVAYSSQLHLAVAGTRGGAAHVWDLTDPAHPALVGSLRVHSTWIELADFDSSGTHLALCSDDGHISLWDFHDGVPAEPTSMIDGGGMVYTATFSEDGTKLVAAILTTNEVRLYDVSDLSKPVQLGEPLLKAEEYVYTAAFSPDGRLVVATVGDGSLWIWDITTAETPQVVAGPVMWAEGYARSTQFSPDGAQLATAMTDGTVRLWDMTDPAHPQHWAVLEGLGSSAYGLAYWPDGSHISASGADRSVMTYATTSAEATQEVCGVIGQGIALSVQEWDRIAAGMTPPQICS